MANIIDFENEVINIVFHRLLDIFGRQPEKEWMDEVNDTWFERAVFEPACREPLQAALKGDPLLRNLARKRVAALAALNQIGQVFDRDHTSRATHDMLVKMLARAEAFMASEPEVRVE